MEKGYLLKSRGFHGWGRPCLKLVHNETDRKNGPHPKRLPDWSLETEWKYAVCKPPKVGEIQFIFENSYLTIEKNEKESLPFEIF